MSWENQRVFSASSLCGKRKPEGIEEAVEEEGGGRRGVPAPSKGGRDRHLPQTLLAPAVKTVERPRSKAKQEEAAAQRELVGLWLEGTADWAEQRYIYTRPVSFRGDPQDIGISHTPKEGLI